MTVELAVTSDRWLAPCLDFIRGPSGAPWVDSIDERTRAGRPKRVQYRRASSYPSNVGDRFLLDRFMGVAKFLAGLRLSPSDTEMLLALDPDHGDSYRTLCDAVEIALEESGILWRTARGTWVHSTLEHADRGDKVPDELYDEGTRWGFDRAGVDDIVERWRAFLDGLGMRVLAIEQRVIQDEFRAAGTLDRVVHLTRKLRFADGVWLPKGIAVVGDIKSSQLRLANGEPGFWGDYVCQVYLYASSRPYLIHDTPRGRRERRGDWPWAIDQDHAVILHVDLDVRPPTFSIWRVQLAAGRELALLAWGVREHERRTGLFVAGLT